MYIAKQHTSLSLQEIGGYFGGRDHSTVLYAIEKTKKEIDKNEKISSLISEISMQLSC